MISWATIATTRKPKHLSLQRSLPRRLLPPLLRHPQVIPPVFLRASQRGKPGTTDSVNTSEAAGNDFSFNRRKSESSVVDVPGSEERAEDRDARLSTVWLDENNRCLVPDNMINFFKEYSKTPGAHWSNEVVRVERAIGIEWMELAALSQIEAAVSILLQTQFMHTLAWGFTQLRVCSPHLVTMRRACQVLFIVAENDEMANCNKQVQLLAFSKISKATAKEFMEIPCALGGHAGMMDSRGLIGHQHTWTLLVDTMERFLVTQFDDLRPSSGCWRAAIALKKVASDIQMCLHR